MKPQHWFIIWFGVLILLVGILKPDLVDLFAFRLFHVFEQVIIVGIMFGLIFLGLRMMLGRK